MNCFNHPDRSAVAMCRTCGRGLCPDCVRPVGHELTCGDPCESKVRKWQALPVPDPEALANAAHVSGTKLKAIALLILGTALLCMRFWAQREPNRVLEFFLAAFGLLLLVRGSWMVLSSLADRPRRKKGTGSNKPIAGD